MSQPTDPHPFDESYYKEGPYANTNFGRFSQYWWSNRIYAQLVKKHGPPAGRVLEVGCGLGHLLARRSDRYTVYGSDINAWALEQARRNAPQGDFRLLSAEDLSAYENEFFQVVIAKHVVEHLPQPAKALAEMSRILAPGGLLLLATPNFASPMRAHKGADWVGYRDPTHISLKVPDEWLALLEQVQLQPRKVFSDGFWDAPYLPYIPTALQKVFFGAPGGLQAILGWSIIPVQMGESLIVLADKA